MSVTSYQSVPSDVRCLIAEYLTPAQLSDYEHSVRGALDLYGKPLFAANQKLLKIATDYIDHRSRSPVERAKLYGKYNDLVNLMKLLLETKGQDHVPTKTQRQVVVAYHGACSNKLASYSILCEIHSFIDNDEHVNASIERMNKQKVKRITLLSTARSFGSMIWALLRTDYEEAVRWGMYVAYGGRPTRLASISLTKYRLRLISLDFGLTTKCFEIGNSTGSRAMYEDELEAVLQCLDLPNIDWYTLWRYFSDGNKLLAPETDLLTEAVVDKIKSATNPNVYLEYVRATQ